VLGRENEVDLVLWTQGRIMLQVEFQCHYTDVLIILVVKGAGGMYLINVNFLPTSAITIIRPMNKV